MSAFRIALFSSLCSMALTAGMAHAQDQTEPKEEITEVIITGTAYGVSKDALMSNVDVMTRDDIDHKPAQSLGDTLAVLPGVRSSGFAPGASRPVIRGLDGFRVLVLNNGMGMIDASAVSPDHAVASDPSEAKRIEVLRGPSALMYGGNAIGGIVNIIDDRIPSKPAKNGAEGRVAVQGSTVDDGRQIAANVKLGKGPLVFTLDAVNRKSEDYRTPVGPESRVLTDLEGEDPDTSDRQVNSFTDLKAYGAGASWIGSRGFAGLSVKTTDLSYGVSGHEDEGPDAEGPVVIGLKQTRYDFRSQLDIGFAGFNRLQADAGYSDYEHTEFEGGETGTQFFSQGHEVRINLLRNGQGQENKKLSGAAGFNFLDRDFRAVGDEAFVPSSTTIEAGLYAQYRYDDGQWGVEGGGRVERKKITAVTGLSRQFDNLSAAFGGFYRPSDHAFFGLSLTRSERAPSDVELLADGPHAGTGAWEIGDADFTSEIGYSLEGTGHWLLDQHTAFSIDAHLYASRFDGYIDLRPTGAEEDGLPVYAYSQTDANFHGFEIEGGANLWSDTARRVRIDLAYDHVRGKSDLGPIARVAPSALTATLSYEGAKWNAHAEVRNVADARDHLAGFELPTKGYTAINLFTSCQVTGRASLFAEVRNLTDTEMREHTSVQKDIVVGPGRNLRVGLVYSF